MAADILSLVIHSRSHRSFKLSPLDYYEIFNEISIGSNVSDHFSSRSRCDSNRNPIHILFLDEEGTVFNGRNWTGMRCVERYQERLNGCEIGETIVRKVVIVVDLSKDDKYDFSYVFL